MSNIVLPPVPTSSGFVPNNTAQVAVHAEAMERNEGVPLAKQKRIHVVNRSQQKFVHHPSPADIVAGEPKEYVLEPRGDAIVPETVATNWMTFRSFGQDQVVLHNPKEAAARDAAAAKDAKEKEDLQKKLDDSQGNEKSLTQQVADLQRQLEAAKKSTAKEEKAAVAEEKKVATETKKITPAPAKAAPAAAKK